MLMQTGWIQASCQVTRRLAWDPTCLPLSLSFSIKNKQNLMVLKSRRQNNLFLENYPAFKGLSSPEHKCSRSAIVTELCLVSVVSNSFKMHFLLTHWVKFDKTSLDGFIQGPLSELLKKMCVTGWWKTELNWIKNDNKVSRQQAWI